MAIITPTPDSNDTSSSPPWGRRQQPQYDLDPIQWDDDDDLSVVEVSLDDGGDCAVPLPQHNTRGGSTSAREGATPQQNQLDVEFPESRDPVEDEMRPSKKRGGGDMSSSTSSSVFAMNVDETPPALPSLRDIESDLFEYRRFLNDPATLQRIERDLRYPPAEELRSYYNTRPDLSSFTINKELDRMEYTVYNYGECVTDGDVIRDRIAPLLRGNEEDDMLFRCANQSLLADAIASLTGDCTIIRRQFLATAHASRCHFIIGLDRKYVKCYCDLVIAMPHIDGLLEFATLRLSVFFVPSAVEPTLSVHALQLSAEDVSDLQLRSAARCIMMDLYGYNPPPLGVLSRRLELCCACDPNRYITTADCSPNVFHLMA
mmetsp:Transcript_26565/g.32170  ORF Transcript_26565/g.32170 Transcript_26565/m.32170 type:complete len:374 (-) Transcript_26565:44-1165(-)|eukprot:CAMPEP_0172492424 /NCGR_PEP_ID=MMETSP1066-20121228/23575_1 /TAXON_ID=671091 /ORGANISM="Coscinodiscus wailesii, Strain CCMP2513" /LENGTH=373 /DNA_ID=CAMNT_0013262047 /DNA_START=37 /DNA_END=1158 /DNA_ORIENTATION=+